MSALNRFSKLTMSMLMRYGRKSSSIQTSVRNCSRSGAPAADSQMHNTSKFDKRVLVWCRQFESFEKVPEQVTVAQMKRARDFFRIRVNIMMIIATFFGCFIMIRVGRHLRNSGESLTKINQRWEEDVKAKARQEAAEKESSKTD